VRLRVRHVRVLVRLEAAGDLLGEPRRDGVVRLGESWSTAVGVITTSAPYARSIEIFSWLILSGMTKMQR
jgi:hypothetical protein